MKKVIIVMFSLVLMFVGCELNNQNEGSIFANFPNFTHSMPSDL